MKEKGVSESVLRIIQYVKTNKNLPENEKRFLIKYAARLHQEQKENIKEVPKKQIIADLRRANELLSSRGNQEDSQKAGEALAEIVAILSNDDTNKKVLVEASYRTDKLYVDMDLKMRDKSSIAYDLQDLFEDHQI